MEYIIPSTMAKVLISMITSSNVSQDKNSSFVKMFTNQQEKMFFQSIKD